MFLVLCVILWVLVEVFSHQLQKEFAENREQILRQVKVAADAGDQAQVVKLGDKYGFIHDPELDKYLNAAHTELKAAEEKKRAAEAAAEAKKRATEKAAEEKARIAEAAAEEKRRAAAERERVAQAKADAIKQAEEEKAEAARMKYWNFGADAGFIAGFSDERSGLMKPSTEEVDAAARRVSGNLPSDEARRDFIRGFEGAYERGWNSAK